MRHRLVVWANAAVMRISAYYHMNNHRRDQLIVGDGQKTHLVYVFAQQGPAFVFSMQALLL